MCWACSTGTTNTADCGGHDEVTAFLLSWLVVGAFSEMVRRLSTLAIPFLMLVGYHILPLAVVAGERFPDTIGMHVQTVHGGFFSCCTETGAPAGTHILSLLVWLIIIKLHRF